MNTYDRRSQASHYAAGIADKPREAFAAHELDAAPAKTRSRPAAPAARASAGMQLLKALTAPAFPPVRKDPSLAITRPERGNDYFQQAIKQQDKAAGTRAVADAAFKIPTNSTGGRLAADRHARSSGQRLDPRSGHAVAEILARQNSASSESSAERTASSERFLNGAKDIELKELGSKDDIRSADIEARNAWERRLAGLAADMAPVRR